MSRSVPWRRNCPDILKRRIDQALEARFYILRESGPTGFLVKQEDDEKKYKVYLGDPNSCTCASFTKDKELCIHILWILLRKFRLGKENALLFQQGLVEREINEIIQGVHIHRQRSAKIEEVQVEEKGKLPPKSIDTDDVCPICQEELKDCKEPLTHCKYGCGNNIHIKCMKIWAQHRKTNGDNIVKCPLCRSDFGTYQDIIQEFHKLSAKLRRTIETNDLHIGATCWNCQISPIRGKCFRCVVCLDYHLCQECFFKETHTQHSFQFRQNTNQRWRPASRHRNKISAEGITDADLRESDGHSASGENRIGAAGTLLQSLLTSNSLEVKERHQCHICRSAFRLSDCVYRLSCQHTFHKNCTDDLMSRGNSVCPVDGQSFLAKDAAHLQLIHVVGRSGAVEGNVDRQLTILGINPLSMVLNSRARVAAKPSRRRSRNGSLSSTDDLVSNTDELAINGSSSRRLSNTTAVESRLDPEEVAILPSPLCDYSSPAHPGNQYASQSSTHQSYRLPPVHPKSGQRNRPVNTVHRKAISTTRSSQAMSKKSNEDLSLGVYGPISNSKELSTPPKRAHSNPSKKRLSSGAMASNSSSEPNLVALTDAFRVSSILNVKD